jgi:hypothetical protein
MNVDAFSSCVRPKAVVDLTGVDQLSRHDRRTSKQRSKFDCLVLGQIGNRCHMAFWLHDHGAESERTNAVFDEPEAGSMNEPAWEF